MNLYFRIWADAIIRLRSIPKNVGMWKFYSMTFISVAMALNMWFLIFLVIAHGGITFPHFPFELNVLPGSKLNGFLSFFSSFLLPMLLINYYFIFYQGKWKGLIIKARYRNGRLFMSYFLGSLIVMVLYFVVLFVIVKL